jgi:hypothetical protein
MFVKSKKVFILIFLLLIALFSLTIYYLYKKVYLQNMVLNKIENFEHFIQNIKNKKYELNEDIINHIMEQWTTIEQEALYS